MYGATPPSAYMYCRILHVHVSHGRAAPAEREKFKPTSTCTVNVPRMVPFFRSGTHQHPIYVCTCMYPIHPLGAIWEGGPSQRGPAAGLARERARAGQPPPTVVVVHVEARPRLSGRGMHAAPGRRPATCGAAGHMQGGSARRWPAAAAAAAPRVRRTQHRRSAPPAR
eukprot:scaffold2004_cov420-Prasinococcus_capsulatus_cf.AAC.13